ncbi:MAG: efflux RND transporter periplasmic adaptor subunit [Gammaproteobacteria bacterium]|jgi:RND family efflux transporter MFP subunit
MRRQNSRRSLSRNPLFPALIVGCAALFAGGCEKPPAEQKTEVRPVKILTVQASGPTGQREYPATIKATQQADMGFEVPGRMEEFLVKEGQLVHKGDVLARLDDRDYQYELEKARANQRKALADLNRSLSIYREDPGAISTGAIDSDRRAKEVTDASVQQAEKAVEDTILRAPFDGYVARKLVEDFANVQAKEPVLILQDVSELEVEVSVPERDMVGGERTNDMDELTARVKPEVSLTSMPGLNFPARIKEFATTADPGTRTFQVTLIFDVPDDVSIFPGMTARVHARVANGNNIRVPVGAVVSNAQYQAFVWKVDPDSMTVSPAPVELGDMQEDEVEISSGLQGGDMIAVSGLRYLQDGMQVRRFGE